MVWFFERGENEIRVEVRYDRIAAEYVIVREARDGAQQIERFADVPAFKARLVELEQQFEAGAWARRGPVFLRDGWKH